MNLVVSKRKYVKCHTHVIPCILRRLRIPKAHFLEKKPRIFQKNLPFLYEKVFRGVHYHFREKKERLEI